MAYSLLSLETSVEEEYMKAISLMYHDAFQNGDSEKSGFRGPGAALYKVDIGEMRAQFTALANTASLLPASVVELSENLFATTTNKIPLFITFDDGGASAASLITPLLEEFGWIGHFFVTAERIGTPGFLTAEQVREIRTRGHIIGSHSWSHPNRISSLSSTAIFEEWSKSASVLSGIIEENVITASIPGGAFSRGVADAAFESGIRYLFTSEPRSSIHHGDGSYLLGRYTIRQGHTVRNCTSLASPTITPIQITQKIAWNLKKTAKKIGGESYEAIRSSLLRRKEDT